jgi:hypothetical protein
MKRNIDSNYRKFDDYSTPKHAWIDIQHIIPSNKIIWDPFYLNGTSGKHLRELGFDVIHENVDFFTTSNNADIIVSNPPFSQTKQILTRLRLIDKPFILIMSISKLSCQYTRNIFKNSEYPLQIIIPAKRIHFIKVVDGKEVHDCSDKCNFDCFYYCYKIGLPDNITWLNN